MCECEGMSASAFRFSVARHGTLVDHGHIISWRRLLSGRAPNHVGNAMSRLSQLGPLALVLLRLGM